MSVNPSILIIEDDADLNHYLTEFLQRNGFLINSLRAGSRALTELEQTSPDLVILDLNLPDVDGQTLCKEIKQLYPKTSVIILTAQEDTHTVVNSFNLGADDYITKPFSSEELLARIKRRLKTGNPNQIMSLSDLTLDPKSMEIRRGEDLLELTQTEYKLLHYLLQNQGQVLTREMILSHVWEYKPDADSRVVDVYIGYLRKKMDDDYEPKLIHSVRGFGYILQDKS